ncbi:MAG: hypothetical protein C0483_18485 [Pirellula sp.]|nr:hypothetical protein [Pirellula sp.]
MIRRTISVIGSLVCLAGLSLGVIHLWHSGWLDRLMPTPRVAAPVSIDLFGPKECLAGGEHFFHVEVDGPAGDVQWELIPDVPGALTPSFDKRKARFQSVEPGLYIVTTRVAGDGRQVASSYIEFDNLLVQEEADEPPAEPQPIFDLESIKAMMAPQAPPVPTIAELVRHSLEQVNSANQVEEAHRIAGIIKSIINRVTTGLIAPDVDVTLELESQLELALGEHARPWGLFIADLRAIIGNLRDQGHITTAASTVPTLTEIAAALSSVH